MPYTNSTTVQHKGTSLDLAAMTRSELEALLSRIKLDVADINEQIDRARTESIEEGIRYDRAWMKNAITASRIKLEDMIKIKNILDKIPALKKPTRLLSAIDVLIEQMDEILDPEDGYHSQLFGQAEHIQRLVEELE